MPLSIQGPNQPPRNLYERRDAPSRYRPPGTSSTRPVSDLSLNAGDLYRLQFEAQQRERAEYWAEQQRRNQVRLETFAETTDWRHQDQRALQRLRAQGYGNKPRQSGRVAAPPAPPSARTSRPRGIPGTVGGSSVSGGGALTNSVTGGILAAGIVAASGGSVAQAVGAGVGTGVGYAAGTVVGAAVGTFIGGPAGAAIGGQIGGAVGSALGGIGGVKLPDLLDGEPVPDGAGQIPDDAITPSALPQPVSSPTEYPSSPGQPVLYQPPDGGEPVPLLPPPPGQGQVPAAEYRIWVRIEAGYKGGFSNDRTIPWPEIFNGPIRGTKTVVEPFNYGWGPRISWVTYLYRGDMYGNPTVQLIDATPKANSESDYSNPESFSFWIVRVERVDGTPELPPPTDSQYRPVPRPVTPAGAPPSAAPIQPAPPPQRSPSLLPPLRPPAPEPAPPPTPTEEPPPSLLPDEPDSPPMPPKGPGPGVAAPPVTVGGGATQYNNPRLTPTGPVVQRTIWEPTPATVTPSQGQSITRELVAGEPIPATEVDGPTVERNIWVPRPATVTPAQEQVIEERRDAFGRLLPSAGVAALAGVGIGAALAAIPKAPSAPLGTALTRPTQILNPITRTVRAPALPRVATTTKPSPCRCNGPILAGQRNLESRLQGTAPAIAAGATGDAASLAAIMQKLNKMQQFAEKAWTTTRLQKALDLITLAGVLHNASLLSRDVGETLGYAIDNVLHVVGIRLKDEKGDAIGVSELVGGAVSSVLQSILGEEIYRGIGQAWNKANRILSSASSIVWTIRSIGDSTQEVLEWTAENTGKIGNALKRWGVVGERAYPWMAERVTAQDAVRRRYRRILEGLETAEDAASSFAMVTGEVREIQEEIVELGEQRQRFTDSVRDLVEDADPDNSDIPATAEEEKAASVSPDLNPSDLERGQGGE